MKIKKKILSIWRDCFDMASSCNGEYRVTSTVWLFANEYRMHVKESHRSYARYGT